MKTRAPLDWDHDCSRTYGGELGVLGIKGRSESDPPAILPHLPVLFEGMLDEKAISVELLFEDFVAPERVAGALEFYRREAGGGEHKEFFDGRNARLVEVTPHRLVFQGCSYFDYCATNLALDLEVPPLGDLRSRAQRDGTLEPLEASVLANATGISGLVFTDDGYMLVQRRAPSVLFRRGELCSGASGTVDWVDIDHAVRRGGCLSDLQAERELVEELGVRAEWVRQRVFLGITRELVRGGAPEMFYAFEIEASLEQVRARTRRDREGRVFGVLLGDLAKAEPGPGAVEEFWNVVDAVRAAGEGCMSMPLLTHLGLWAGRRGGGLWSRSHLGGGMT